MEYLDARKKSMGYEVIEGDLTQSMKGSFVSKHGTVKKTLRTKG
jgi:hypothetical protein